MIIYTPSEPHVCQFPWTREHLSGTVFRCTCGRYFELRSLSGFVPTWNRISKLRGRRIERRERRKAEAAKFFAELPRPEDRK